MLLLIETLYEDYTRVYIIECTQLHQCNTSFGKIKLCYKKASTVCSWRVCGGGRCRLWVQCAKIWVVYFPCWPVQVIHSQTSCVAWWSVCACCCFWALPTLGVYVPRLLVGLGQVCRERSCEGTKSCIAHHVCIHHEYHKYGSNARSQVLYLQWMLFNHIAYVWFSMFATYSMSSVKMGCSNGCSASIHPP